ncbi:centriole and centriolar satellite protein ofd1 isoform X2 [Nelusetta ayraudi]|uniref:centriole and centriolar satellite protein ofd1 isoform X2 n=1 Tax=Nelusetta ayraudi TaxID=303726 RepID=UPI003F7228C3
MSSPKEETLSPDELRKRLYQTFKNRGVLDTLKTQLRNQLIHELKPQSLAGGDPVTRAVVVKSEPLLSACNSLVADHLRVSGYEYSLSVFCPESGLCKGKVSQTEELLHLLHISPATAFYKSLSNSIKENKGLLISLLMQLTHHFGPSSRHDADTQTTSFASYGDSLVEKMKMIDKEYVSPGINENYLFSSQSRLDSYRREIEAQAQAEINIKMQHFQDVEIAKVRMEEKRTFHKEFDKLKQELERNYEMKAKALIEREKNAIDRLQKQQEIEEKNVYMQRQSILKEIDTLRNRENELRMRTESFERTCQIHEEKVKNVEELLRRRELTVKTLEDTYDQRLKNELSKYELDLKQEFVKRTEKLTENESRIKVETARIHKESAAIDSKLEEHNRTCSELQRLQVELETARQQISLLSQQNELLRERLEAVSDYPSLRKEKTELQGQLRLLKTQLEESREENTILQADLAKPSKEQLALQMELQRLQNARRLDVEEFDNQKQVLQAQLQSEVQRCSLLSTELTECKERLQWQTKHLEDIRTQLQQTQQALENEVMLNPKPSLVDRSILGLSVDKLVPPDIYVDRALLRGRLASDDLCEAGGAVRGHRLPWDDSIDLDTDPVAKAKARIQELQVEAETLEEAYRNYQQRAVRSTLGYMLPQRARSPQAAHLPQFSGSSLRKHVPGPSHSRSPQRSKVSHTPLSPQNASAASAAVCDVRKGVAATQPRVFFPEGPNQAAIQPLFLKEGGLQDESSSPPRHPSSSWYSSPKTVLLRKTAEEVAVSQVEPPSLSPDRRRPLLAPRDEAATSGDSSPELSLPLSPQLRSTARDQHSPPELQPVLSSVESSPPQPEKLNLEDLTGNSSEPGHIPELLLDTAVPLSEEAPIGPAAPRPPDLPEDPIDMSTQPVVPPSSGEAARGGEEDEEQKWERERKQRHEQRQREQQEAREREMQELQELERLEKETSLEDVAQLEKEEEEEEDSGTSKGQGEERKQEDEDDGKDSEGENPLEKYMKMVLETRGKQQEKHPNREERHSSPEARTLSEEKDNSIAAYSHKDEDDDFW